MLSEIKVDIFISEQIAENIIDNNNKNHLNAQLKLIKKQIHKYSKIYMILI